MHYLIGVDLGGTQLRAVLIDRGGQIQRFARTDTAAAAGPAAVIDQITTLIATLLRDAGVTADAISGIGVGVPGPVDPVAGIVRRAPNLAGWENVPLRAALSERIGLPVVVGNDANVAALGEWRFGSGQGTQHFAYVTISTGIGGGVIAEGRLLLGRYGLAAEVGHMIIDPHGPRCGCGNYGCWEALASGTALARAATQAVQHEPSLIRELAGSLPISGAHVAHAATHGDALAQRLMQREGELIGIGLVNLLHLYAPERIALGGGVTKSWPLLEATVQQTINTRAMPPYRDTPITLATLGDSVGVLGAAALLL
ncbi:ROK family protein [Kallotenue papyrolyticum]|uniref:ROK family protein n=1 Tax=Kallotenue papyrolyticum TaxID=1325125 RepID=UPI0004B888A2|nr:ROK family protein [Kallotenue papyrolyticum]